MADNVGVHQTHCCIMHGCKYGDEDCPVENGEIRQKYICEDCDYDNIKSVDDLIAMHQLGLRKCHECGSIYVCE